MEVRQGTRTIISWGGMGYATESRVRKGPSLVKGSLPARRVPAPVAPGAAHPLHDRLRDLPVAVDVGVDPRVVLEHPGAPAPGLVVVPGRPIGQREADVVRLTGLGSRLGGQVLHTLVRPLDKRLRLIPLGHLRPG